jgi:cell wall-associated NlpC family hydrolase
MGAFLPTGRLALQGSYSCSPRLGGLFALLVVLSVAALCSAPSAHADGQAIVNAAASQAGRPYCWDGGNEHGPTHGAGDLGNGGCGGGTVGFDCTGLAIFAVYQGTGISGLPHNGEGNRWAAKGTAIMSQASLQPGDVVFFGGTFGDFDHAGIYAGNGMIWDADDFNVPVQEHSLAWIEHALPFVGAVRFAGSPPGGGSPPPPPSDNGGIDITGVASQKCLDVVGGGTANGTGIQLYDCNGSPQQHWVYWQGQLEVYGNYGKCLDADSTAGGANGTRIQIWDCNGGQNQQWIAGGDGSLRSAASGRCLDAVGGSNANGTPLQLYDCSGVSWQKWIGPPSPNGGNPVRSFGTGRCLDVPGASISPGTRVQMWDCNGGAQQQWILDGTQLRVYADMCLDAVGGETANGTQIQVWPCNGDPQQQWTWGADGTIRSIPSGRCLDVVGGSLANGTKLQLWDCSGVSWQHWVVNAPANGGPPIIGVASSKCLDVIGGNTSPGARVQMYDCLGNAQQQWVQDGTQLRAFGNECLDAVDGGTTNGTEIQVWPCNGDPQQQWTWGADGTIRSIPSGRCLDVVGGSNANGTPLQLYDCSGVAWQKFKRPVPLAVASPPTSGSGHQHAACIAPRLRHMTLRQAARALKHAHCRLRLVRRPAHSRSHYTPRVDWQSVRSGTRHPGGYQIGIALQ